MSELNDVRVDDWLMIASTIKGSSFILQQVTSVTSGLVKTQNYTFFRRDGRPFSVKQKSLTARPATDTEIEKWLSRQKKHQMKVQQDESPESVLARYLTSVNADEWARLGVAQLKKIKAALGKSWPVAQQSKAPAHHRGFLLFEESVSNNLSLGNGPSARVLHSLP